jgi:hypothetical protein
LYLFENIRFVQILSKSLKKGCVGNWLSNFINFFYYMQLRYLWACANEVGDHNLITPSQSHLKTLKTQIQS